MNRLPPVAFIAGAVVLGVVALALLIWFRPGSSAPAYQSSRIESQTEGVLKGFDSYNLPGGSYPSVTPPVRQTNPQPVPAPAPDPGVACTMDAMQCPDGSYVGRVPPSCQFAACPGN